MTKQEHILNILEQFEKCDLSDSSKKKKIKKVKIQNQLKRQIPCKKPTIFLERCCFFYLSFKQII